MTLDHTNWQKHLSRHPEIVPHLAQLPTVLAQPDLVIEAARDGSYYYYRGGIGTGRFHHAWLLVIVTRFGRQNKVVSWRFVFQIQTQGVRRWPRP